MTSGNVPAAGCSRCRERCAATLITASGPADERSQRQRPESAFPQVKVGPSGQGRSRTADLPLFRREIAPGDMSLTCGHVVLSGLEWSPVVWFMAPILPPTEPQDLFLFESSNALANSGCCTVVLHPGSIRHPCVMRCAPSGHVSGLPALLPGQGG